ncbi:MAG: 3-methyl-2-oxobutanoate hydroxymethyltransferase [Deltaproteobacteria bacterium]|nr:3-methyl-2-oxobutanoate hydroxymethyltransferase [Deltaproteobacteria bacterium]
MTKRSEPTGSPKLESKVTVTRLRAMKAEGDRITMVTCYDASFARLAERGGAEVLLVGDSLGMVIQGEETTIPVTIDDIVYHTRAVRRGARHAHVVADMPFMSYQGGWQHALQSAGRLFKEGGAESVKLEGGEEVAESIDRLVRAGVPVMGHVGLTPQSVHAMGGFKIQGKDPEGARRILADARAVEQAGAYAIVLEGMPLELARVITASLSIPTIGIGAGPDCDGQVLVIYDLLGMNPDFAPKFVKRYAELGTVIPEAIARFREEVKGREFPADEHSFHAKAPLFRPTEVARPKVRDATDGDDGVGGLYGVPV